MYAGTFDDRLALFSGYDAFGALTGLTLEALAPRFATLQLDWRWIGQAVSFDEAAYGRQLLLEAPDWALLLLTWLPGQHSPIHDHGGSEGLTRVLAGTLQETLFAPVGTRARPLLQRSHAAGDVFLEREDTLHQVRNAARRPAVSLHLYRPGLSELRTYETLDPP
jgi:cysteine dioxygenase